jgi:hypothetical protein
VSTANSPSRDQTWSRRPASGLCPRYSVLSTKYSVRTTHQLATIRPAIRNPQSAIRTLGGLLALLLLAFPASAADFPSDLSALASKCDELGLTDQAAITRAWVIDRHPGRQYLFLPSTSDSTTPKPTAPEPARHWHRRFLELRRERAAALFAEAKKQIEKGDGSRAYQLLFEILREDEDHAEARRILGYERRGSDWRLRGHERAAARPAPLAHPKFGWPARQHWSLETAHFSIASNHSAKEIVEAGQQLEKLHTLWQQIFFRYWATTEALAARFAGTNEPLAPERPKLRVVLFKNRQEYAPYVASAHPRAASTLGFYDDEQRVSYFFASDTSVYPTWYHEATHQLFQEYTPPPARGIIQGKPGHDQNFWALEGAALYMESLAEHAGFWTAGGCESDRLQFARYRVLSGDLQLPAAQIIGYSRDDLQKSDDIARIYTQAAGLAHFLSDGAHGAHREAFLDYCLAIYEGRDTRESLFLLTGQSPQQIDAQYRAFLNLTDADLAGIPNPERCKNLSLCRTAITDAGLARFAGTKNLKWLDLSLTAATDEGLKHFAANQSLKQLFLDSAKITDASLSLIATFKQLEELDLSNLPITDEAVLALRPLKRLQQLHLTGTQVTPGGRQRLQAALPKLKIEP